MLSNVLGETKMWKTRDRELLAISKIFKYFITEKNIN
jgi:hypothetical protein